MTEYSTPTKHDGRAVLFAVAELLVITTFWAELNKSQNGNALYTTNNKSRKLTYPVAPQPSDDQGTAQFHKYLKFTMNYYCHVLQL